MTDNLPTEEKPLYQLKKNIHPRGFHPSLSWIILGVGILLVVSGLIYFKSSLFTKLVTKDTGIVDQKTTTPTAAAEPVSGVSGTIKEIKTEKKDSSEGLLVVSSDSKEIKIHVDKNTKINTVIRDSVPRPPRLDDKSVTWETLKVGQKITITFLVDVYKVDKFSARDVLAIYVEEDEKP